MRKTVQGRNDVDLFVRSWVEIFCNITCYCICITSTSSWGRELKLFCNTLPAYFLHRRPLREVVSWNAYVCVTKVYAKSRPLREVVSWNTTEIWRTPIATLSTSSWGRELKYIRFPFSCPEPMSTSSWGRELKWRECACYRSASGSRPLREVVSWNAYTKTEFSYEDGSTSSWGRELKYRYCRI